MRLQSLIERYLAYRQALGQRFKTNAIILRAFGRAIGAHAALAAVGARQVRAFLDGKGPITSAWFGRHSALLGFYHYAITRGYVAVSPLPAVLPQRPPPFVPHIYTQDELRRLLRATDSYQRKRSSLEPVTMRVLILLLYGAGLRLQEAIALDRADVDLENLLLKVRHAKFCMPQSIPVPVSNDAWHKLTPHRVLCLHFFMQPEPLLGIVLQPQQHSTEGQLSQVDPTTAPAWLGQGLPVQPRP